MLLTRTDAESTPNRRFCCSRLYQVTYHLLRQQGLPAFASLARRDVRGLGTLTRQRPPERTPRDCGLSSLRDRVRHRLDRPSRVSCRPRLPAGQLQSSLSRQSCARHPQTRDLTLPTSVAQQPLWRPPTWHGVARGKTPLLRSDRRGPCFGGVEPTPLQLVSAPRHLPSARRYG